MLLKKNFHRLKIFYIIYYKSRNIKSKTVSSRLGYNEYIFKIYTYTHGCQNIFKYCSKMLRSCFGRHSNIAQMLSINISKIFFMHDF